MATIDFQIDYQADSDAGRDPFGFGGFLEKPPDRPFRLVLFKIARMFQMETEALRQIKQIT